MKKRKHFVIPQITSTKIFPNISQLQMNNATPSDEVITVRENYAKMALMMFYPYRTPCDLLKNGSHWELFDDERTRYFDNKRQALEIQLENRDNNLQRPELPKGKFWKKKLKCFLLFWIGFVFMIIGAYASISDIIEIWTGKK